MGFKTVLLMACYVSVALMTLSCGDMANKKFIVKSYYLTDGEEQGNYLICLLSPGGSLIAKTPRGVVEYGYTDSFLVAKILRGKDKVYYVINMKKDSEMAKEEDFRLGPLSEVAYERLDLGQSKVYIDWKSIPAQRR